MNGILNCSVIYSSSTSRRYKILYVRQLLCILSRLDRNLTELEIRRAFASFQIMTILEGNHHGILIVAHNLMLYEDAKRDGRVRSPSPEADLRESDHRIARAIEITSS